MSLPKNYLVDTTIELLGSSFVELYEKRIGNNLREFLFLLFYDEFIEPETGRQRNLREIKAYYYKDKYKRTKQNWFQSLKKSTQSPKKTPKELMGEIRYIQDGIDKGFVSLQSTYAVDTMEDLIKTRLAEVEEWAGDDECLLTEYKYISDKTPRQIENAIKCDAIITVTKMVIEKYGGEFTSIVKEVSDWISHFPLPGKSGIEKFKNITHEEGSGAAVEEYRQGEIMVTTMLGNDLIRNHQTVALSQKDYEVFNYVLSKRDIEFVKNQKIFLDIGEIVKNVYASRGKKEYAQVKERLLKLKDVSFKIKDENDELYYFDLFDHLRLYDNEMRVEIKVNEFIHKNVMNDHVTKIYSDRIKNFLCSISENMVFILQKERFVKMFSSHGYNEHSYHAYTYEYFTRRIRFPSRNKEKNLRLIEDALREIVANQVTVRHYKKTGDSFHISFLPVSKYEAEDLIESQPIKPLLKLNEAPLAE